MRGLQWYPGEFSLFLYHFESKMHIDYMYLSLAKHLMSLSGGHVSPVSTYLFVGGSVSRMTRKLLNGFPQNPDGGRVPAQIKTRYLLVHSVVGK